MAAWFSRDAVRSQLWLLCVSFGLEDGISNCSCSVTDNACYPLWRFVREFQLVPCLSGLAQVLVANLLFKLRHSAGTVADRHGYNLLDCFGLPGRH